MKISNKTLMLEFAIVFLCFLVGSSISLWRHHYLGGILGFGMAIICANYMGIFSLLHRLDEIEKLIKTSKEEKAALPPLSGNNER